VDEFAMLLDRVAAAHTDLVEVPPVSTVEARSRRRSMWQSLSGLGVVVVVVIGLIVGLASIGLASEYSPRQGQFAATSAAAR